MMFEVAARQIYNSMTWGSRLPVDWYGMGWDSFFWWLILNLGNSPDVHLFRLFLLLFFPQQVYLEDFGFKKSDELIFCAHLSVLGVCVWRADR